MRMYNWDGALLPLLDARKAAESCDDLDSVFDEDIEISHCLFQLRDAELALTFANCAMEYALSVESSDRLFWALTRRGNALYLMGKLDEAEDLFTKALGNLHKDYEFVWELILLAERNLAKTLLFKGQTVAADESFRRLNTVAEIIGSDPLNSEVFLRKTAGNKME